MTTSQLSVGDLLAALGAKTPAPARGAAAALTAAMGAALAELAARVAGDQDALARAHALVARLQRLADDDAEAYAAFIRSPSAQTQRRTIDVPQRIAADADEAAAIAEGLARTLGTAVAADAEAGTMLARAAATVARRLAEINAKA